MMIVILHIHHGLESEVPIQAHCPPSFENWQFIGFFQCAHDKGHVLIAFGPAPLFELSQNAWLIFHSLSTHSDRMLLRLYLVHTNLEADSHRDY